MPKREEETNCCRALAFGNQFAGNIVDSGDMVGIHRVTQAKTVSKKCGAEKHRIMPECNQRPDPGEDVSNDQACKKAGNSYAQAVLGIVRHGASEYYTPSGATQVCRKHHPKEISGVEEGFDPPSGSRWRSIAAGPGLPIPYYARFLRRRVAL